MLNQRREESTEAGKRWKSLVDPCWGVQIFRLKQSRGTRKMIDIFCGFQWNFDFILVGLRFLQVFQLQILQCILPRTYQMKKVAKDLYVQKYLFDQTSCSEFQIPADTGTPNLRALARTHCSSAALRAPRLAPRSFLKFPRDPSGCIAIVPFFTFVVRKAAAHGLVRFSKGLRGIKGSNLSFRRCATMGIHP